jgi:methionyl-tRNA formyltransferase
MEYCCNNPAMMTIDPGNCSFRYAFFSTGANFSCEVLQALRGKNFSPALIVLPEYPPAERPPVESLLSGSTVPQRRLFKLADGLDIVYAPSELQTQCAQSLRQQSIEFILVACWPYLITGMLLDSASRAALNLHPSLLPDYRGADPIGEQLQSGEVQPGVSLHLLSDNFDEGDIVAQSRLSSTRPYTDRTSLENDCAQLGSKLFIDALNDYDAGWHLQTQKLKRH